MIDPRGNTLETIEKECSEPGWFYTYDNRPNEAISAEVIQRAKLIRPYVPMEMELFAAPDGSVQWEDNRHTLEVYSDRYRYDDEEVSFDDAVEKLKALDYNEREFKLELTFPKEFREHFQMDRFNDSLQRILTDIKPTQYSTYDGMSGNYENELVKKLIKVFQGARIL
jgi:hypothetical protein